MSRIGGLLHLLRTSRLVWRLMRDGRISTPAKLIVPSGLLYALFPVDLLPDFLLALGQFDDLTVLFLSVMLFLRVCPPDVVREHMESLSGQRPRQDPPGDSGKVIDGEYRVLE